jgi:hypothetical protein
MPKKEKETVENQTVKYRGVEYDVSKWTEIQGDDYNHIVDLELKINRAAFNLRQLNGGLEYYRAKLDKSLVSDNEE